MKTLKHRKGQESGTGPVTLVIILTLLLTLYIVLLPPSERKELLDPDDVDSDSVIINKNLTLLSESPGRLDYRNLDKYEHRIDAFTLYQTTESAELKKENSFYIKNGWFDKKTKSIRFPVINLENTENIMLSFTTTKHQGLLTVKFNGVPVFENELRTTFVDPITIDNDMVQEENMIEFDVSGVGWAFWTTNEYLIEGFRVVADVSDTSRQASRNVFVVSQQEKENLDKVKVKFSPDCIPNQVGRLEILINNNRIFWGIPDCGILNTKEFSTGHIDEGENSLVFRTEQGSYLVDQITVVNELKDIIYPFYYFDINESIFEEVENGKIDIFLNFQFFDDSEYKKARIYINGHKTSMNTYDETWDKNINSYVEEGTNGIKIEPDDTILDIIRLTVEARED